MERLLILLPLVIALPASAQEVIGSSGASHSDTNGSITYTIGEPVIATASTGSTTLTQGFQQPWADITTLVDGPASNGPNITVYPNPVRHTLHIAMDGSLDGHSYVLHDAAGKQVTDGRISSSITDLDMQSYASGSYFLHVLGSNDNSLRSFKISVTQ